MVPHVTGPERSKFKIQSRVSTEYVTFTPSESHAALQQKLTRRLKPAVLRQKGFPADSVAENLPAGAGDGGLILESGSLPGGQHLNWGLVAELYQRTALVTSLKAGKFSMQVQ